MKKILRILGTIILFLIISLTVFYFMSNESLPEGNSNKEADVLATKMLEALNYEAYENTHFIEWSFRGKHFYKWNKKNNIVEVSWGKNKVFLETKNIPNSKVFINNKQVEDSKILKKATDFFNNDSFWLVAPYKVFEEGIERKIVQHENKDALMVTYTTGGTTPGDSYLWILDENYKPIAYKMWVSIIPTGGMEVSWNDWTTTQSGAVFPTKHELSIGTLDMGNVKGYN